ncbi:MAG: AAA family ATPase [Nitrosomonas sp.]|uniref:ATP-dependent nuclease n=1 Tax=Nitrosomonas sp. TaxID=42353 RepID=UPI00273406C1|nr:AAA family ATPase [Nitrosomonas sp.]MDP3282208.1 AAA family ATPase [Nitrosomonas sp.]
MKDRFTKVTFKNYKALKNFSVTLSEFNVLVGPNNAGKSTIVGAFRILSEGLRKAASKKPQLISISGVHHRGYKVPLDGLPIATENIFTNYDDSEPAVIEFNLSSGNNLKLVFPENDICYLICEPKSKPVTTPTEFRKLYNATVGFVPVLGPVEHNEPLFQKEAARLALLSHKASRNFRNIWFHYPDDFDHFRELVQSTWPGMDIERPELASSYKSSILHMFCPEERYPREIFWAGFGFQVWCQMLTHIIRAKDASLLIIDEPDIYLHSDLQRQLVEILKQASPDILVATHSTEIISEADPGDLLIVNKKGRIAKRIKDPTQLQSIFGVLGSNLNPTLTQLAKSKRAIFVEGKDFQVLSALSRKLGYQSLANRSDFAVIPVEGFNPARVLNFSEGIELTLGTNILKAVIFDRDYRAPEEIKSLLRDFNQYTALSHIHERKEIENYLLEPSVIQRAIEKRVSERAARVGNKKEFTGSAVDILQDLSDKMRSRVNAQFMSKREKYLKSANPSHDQASINLQMINDFDELWSNMKTRLEIVPGKELLSSLNGYLQDNHSITLTHSIIVNSMKKEEVPTDIVSLLEKLESFRNEPV